MRARGQYSRLVWPLAALALILLYNLVFTPGFFHLEFREGRLFGSVVDILNRSAPITLLSMGMTLVIATGGVDLSVGAIIAIAGALAASLLAEHYSLPAAILAAAGVSLAAGLWNGALVAWLGIQPIVATLVLMVSGRGIAQLLSGGQIITIDNPSFSFMANGSFQFLPFPVTLALGGLAAMWALTRKTALGLFIESVGNNPVASRYAGVGARSVVAAVYAISGLCAGGAGLITAANISAADANNAGLYFELDAILAVLIGGTSLTGGRYTLAGSVIGSLIIQTTTTMILTKGVPVQITLLVKAIIVLAVSLLQSSRVHLLFARRLAPLNPSAA